MALGAHAPLILINFKTYLEATGKRSVELSRLIENIGKDIGVDVAVAPQFCDIAHVAAQVEIPIFAQHIDPVTPGAATGHVLGDSVKAAGATGTLLNHSERLMLLSNLDRSVKLARELGLVSVVCAGNTDSASAASLLCPDMVAIEPPELIGSGRAVSKEQPGVVTESVKAIRRVNQSVKILCGAGVSSGDDVYAALKLGAQGVLVASALVKSAHPVEVIKDFCNGARRFQEDPR
ncbi:MAG TPA: triose-phosphate isomerase [Candidatus Saccharimonadales bacterium]|nr:triose-phosphate isomerase [Candidatus Saccharimonadales bacterium]